jgi:hypothetical protein
MKRPIVRRLTRSINFEPRRVLQSRIVQRLNVTELRGPTNGAITSQQFGIRLEAVQCNQREIVTLGG